MRSLPLLQGIFPTQGLTRSPTWQANSLPTELSGKPLGGPEKNSFDCMGLSAKSYLCFFNTLSRFVTALLPGNKRLLISWLWSLSAVILEPKEIKSVAASAFSCSLLMFVNGLKLFSSCDLSVPPASCWLCDCYSNRLQK